MEDNTKQPLTADASLYNEQPTDTGSLCPSARLSSCTLSISDDVSNGVSVGNALVENSQWFVLRVSYGRIIKAKDFVEAKGLECYVPMRHKQIMKQGKKRIVEQPLLPSFLFVYATRNQAEALCSNSNAKTVPLSTTMKEQIAALRNWAATRAKNASNETLTEEKKEMPILLTRSELELERSFDLNNSKGKK